jgi:hypothetical protein
MAQVAGAIKIQRAVRNWLPRKSCPICMDEITTKNSCVTKCGHDFCLSCLAKSLQSNQTCPLCRGELAPAIDRQAMSQASFENGYGVAVDMMREEMREEMNVGYAYSQHTYELGLDEGRRLAQEAAEDTIQALRRKLDRARRKLDRALKKVVELTPIQVSSL